ncbi:MAG TPA: zinc ribbon domain-containing protein, partial [Armatimonadota bacterium]|nr:zinc ribbon domain-containing protein [Armatimonadota bacterium]
MHCPNCRTALPAGSRFCNSCGAAINATAVPSGERTQSFPPPQPYARPHVTAQPVAPHATQSFPPPPLPVAGKRPVLMLSLMLAVVAAGVAGAGMFIWRKSLPVFGNQRPGSISGPGVTSAGSSGLPHGPGVTSAQGHLPARGAPLTSAPRPNNDIAPPVTMAPNSRLPGGPSVTMAPGAPLAAAPPLTAAPGITHAPPPPPPDNSDFDKYIRWLQFVENERSGLRAQGENEIFRMLPDLMTGGMDMGALTDPDA